MTERDVLNRYAERLADNRLQGLLRELAEAIDQTDDPEQLRRLGTSLKEMGSIALNRRHRL